MSDIRFLFRFSADFDNFATDSGFGTLASFVGGAEPGKI